MFVLKKDRIAVYTYLFNEGVLVVEKDFYKAQHSEELPVANIVVMQLMKGLASKANPVDPTDKNAEVKPFVRRVYAWRHYYYYLTDEGMEFLREYLGIPDEVVPKTRDTRATSRPSRPERDGYRDGPRDGRDKHVEGGFRPEFSREGSGFGRGGGMRSREGFRSEGGLRGGFGRGGGAS